MKKTSNRRVIILSDLDSGYFEQAVFYIRSNAVSNEDMLISEANNIVSEFSKKYTVTRNQADNKKHAAFKIAAALCSLGTLCLILYRFFG